MRQNNSDAAVAAAGWGGGTASVAAGSAGGTAAASFAPEADQGSGASIPPEARNVHDAAANGDESDSRSTFANAYAADINRLNEFYLVHAPEKSYIEIRDVVLRRCGRENRRLLLDFALWEKYGSSPGLADLKRLGELTPGAPPRRGCGSSEPPLPRRHA